MPTAIPIQTTLAPAAADFESRVLIPGLDWETFLAIARSFDKSPGTRVAFDHGILEIMTISYKHEHYKKILAMFIETVLKELGISFKPAGSSLSRSKSANRGVEPDESYYLAKSARIKLESFDDQDEAPPPDLVVEIDISPSKLDRPAIYAALKVPEVWRFDGGNLRIDRLTRTGAYCEEHESKALGFIKDVEIVEWVRQADELDILVWKRRLRAWVARELKSRRSGKRARKSEGPFNMIFPLIARVRQTRSQPEVADVRTRSPRRSERARFESAFAREVRSR